MSFSDDHNSPAKPFAGDETGGVFDAPDVVWHSETTSERIVDTQSGYLVIVRQLEQRQSLSVKRRLGTPPSSNVVLTPDESLKLSKILTGLACLPVERKMAAPEAQAWLDKFAQADDKELIAEFRAYSQPAKAPYAIAKYGLRSVPVAVAISLIMAVCLVGYVVESLKAPKNAQLHQSIANQDPLDKGRVDHFVRQFVSNMLDFNPNTYRVSQIRAMAAMSPELVASYWKDTHFPLSKSVLQALPQDSTVVINRMIQMRLDNKTSDVDVYADLVRTATKVSSPVHLQFKVGSTDDQQLCVLSQKDLSKSGK